MHSQPLLQPKRKKRTFCILCLRIHKNRGCMPLEIVEENKKNLFKNRKMQFTNAHRKSDTKFCSNRKCVEM